uniref:Protein kinase-like domain, concanavalin A-like lectin/glucanase domain protein n=1 Tax=Tanacetum cinerariifolium TaxID=118510 RepID=A0A6L2JE55_TANCI|nr:protein kinase-like domain, concanavalin A-like lectin/glucanase domain protein [Tanacetum cinerariifolium]
MDNTNPPFEVLPSFLIEKVHKLNSILESLNLKPQSSHLGVVCKKEIDSDVILIELIKDDEHPSNDELNEDEDVGEKEFEGNHFDKFPACAHLAPRKNPKNPSRLNNFTGRAKGMHIFVGNFTYFSDFMILKDISSIIDPKVSHVVLGKPFVELSSMTYDSSLGVVKLTNRNEEITYKMPHKIEQFDSLLNDEKEKMKSVYLRNDKDKKKGVEYVMSKILRFYKECLELGPKYQTSQEESSSVTSENHGGVT